jgi:hypothetical protein
MAKDLAAWAAKKAPPSGDERYLALVKKLMDEGKDEETAKKIAAGITKAKEEAVKPKGPPFPPKKGVNPFAKKGE